MSEFPECMKRRGGPEVDFLYGEEQMNGQRCHRIAGHGGNCLFDRSPEFDPVREEARPLTKSYINLPFMPREWTNR